MRITPLQNFIDRYHQAIAPYDRVQLLSPGRMPALRQVNGLVVATLLLFVAIGFALILGGYVDNKPTTASTGLMAAHRQVTLNLAGWFNDGIWWRNKQTPTPLPFTIHGFFFALFGYSIRGILCLHIVVSALAAALLFRITARRFGAWTGYLALLLYATAPLPLHVTLSGWTFVWATFFLLLALDLMDKAVLAKRIPYYLLSGLVLGCAGMSRPENYAVALLVILFVNIPLRYRVAFLLCVFAYPIAQYLHNNLYLGDRPGLRILHDARNEMDQIAILREWIGSVRRSILDQNFAPFLQWLLVPAVLFFGIRRQRFLTALVAYFFIALMGAYVMRRISFNHVGYYYAHVTLLLPFLAALLVGLTRTVATGLRKLSVPPRMALTPALLALIGVLAFNADSLQGAYDKYVFYRVPETVREVRDYLLDHLTPEDHLSLDYFEEVSWMLAEIEGPAGRDLYYYEINVSDIPRPRVNAARKDVAPSEQKIMNNWVAQNYAIWYQVKAPRYLVTLSDSAWARELANPEAMGHYRMYSLRPALGTEVPGAHYLGGTVVFENADFVIVEYPK